MATQIASVPPFGAAPPFMFARPQADDMGWNYRSALLAATAAERADHARRNSRGRIAYLLCELGFQLGCRGIGADAAFPLTRADIADALGVSLSRVKRTLALLTLSRVVEMEGASMRVLDWRRLCSVACYDPRRLELKAEEEELDLPCATDDHAQRHLLTRAGDPACFV